ncbi:transmembrane amino acid transporter protein-domain-containing protein [Polychytrium aggregatum]|uniref:transmembrane amino acid transporter protein-domain-containing protein n=1 Tax=Polychytrium aggregatum TaxID=110093 RepID=UPI0022FEA0D8|nr:transmembrane amino acid transporter protein-domain-containing protein [Polychytrium aggregatum]KAI9204110.1 transmembrane amino acid transporter protein-domain-containing protein [Polychytrium aggregatum]
MRFHFPLRNTLDTRYGNASYPCIIRSPSGAAYPRASNACSRTSQLLNPPLTQPAPVSLYIITINANLGVDISSTGDTTRDIYQWHERQEQQAQQPRRRNSEPDFRQITHQESSSVDPSEISNLRASDLSGPGGFRRFFIRQQASNAGTSQPIITHNFFDFLAIFTYYGGDVHPDAEEQHAIQQESRDRLAGAAQPDAFSSAAEGLPYERGSDPETSSQEPDEATPLVRRSTPSLKTMQGTSAKKAFFLLMKAFVGTGVLFLPKAFSNGGMGFSIILMVVMGWLTLHCMLLLVECSKTLGGSFGDIGEAVYGIHMKRTVLASIAVAQMGFCCAYYIFVAKNLRDFTMNITDCRWILPDWVFIVLQILIYIPLSWVRRIKHFSYTSIVADVFILLGLAYILYYDVTVLSTRGPARDLVWFNLNSFSLFIGTAMFAFEGICLILPIADSMKRPERFSWVMTACIVTIGAIFISVGATGYLTFGEKVETVVFLNLPKGSVVVESLQLFYALAICLSFPLTVYPAIRISEHGIFGELDGKLDPSVKWMKNWYRAAMVSLLGLVAWLGSNQLDRVVSLVGNFTCIPLSFIYPALFHAHIARHPLVKLKDYLIAIMGLVAMVYTTFVTLQQWVAEEPDVPIDRCSPSGGSYGLL